MKKVLGKKLKDFTSEVLGNMTSGGGGNGLAKALLSEVKAQLYEFVGWVDEFYKELTEDEANFKAKPAWRLVGWCAAAIFDAMAEVRARVALLDDPTPLESKAHIIWCVLQCHTIMRSFIHVRFQGHPVIVKEITMFMVTERVDPAELEAMKTRLSDTDALLKDMKASNKRQEDNYNTLKRSLDNLMNEFRPVKAKVAAAKLGPALPDTTSTVKCTGKIGDREVTRKKEGRKEGRKEGSVGPKGGGGRAENGKNRKKWPAYLARSHKRKPDHQEDASLGTMSPHV
jgi:hypothetical protein